MKKVITIFFAALIITVAFTSCLKTENTDNVKSLFAELGMIETNGQSIVTGATLDDGIKVIFSNPAKSNWATKADSTYRALMYIYLTNQQIKEGNTTHIYQAEVATIEEVLDLKVRSLEEAKDWIDDKDPIQYMSGGRAYGYVNMTLRIPTGVASESAKHIFGVALVEQTPKNKVLRFCHNQNGISTAYTAEAMASINVKNLAQDTDTVTVIYPTASGDKVVKYVDASLQGSQTNTQTGTGNITQ